MSISKTVTFALLALTLSGCAGSIERWIVDTRVHQGNVALAHENPQDAELAYRLALRIDPSSVSARTGFVSAAALLAQAQYARGDFDDALSTITGALRYDPASVRLAALKIAIENAKLKREIVISNYPTYREAGIQLQRSYEQLDLANKLILKSLKRFSYTYDTSDLTRAIRQSYELQLELGKNTNRLAAYRQTVESGAPVNENTETSASTGSLLPLP